MVGVEGTLQKSWILWILSFHAETKKFLIQDEKYTLLTQGGKAAFARIYTAPLQAFRASPGSLPRLARFGAPRQGWRTYFFNNFSKKHLEQKKDPNLKN